MDKLQNVNLELKNCVNFFLGTFSKVPSTYGLIPDIFPSFEKGKNISSIAGNGYLYSALVIGVEHNFICKEVAVEIGVKAIKVLKNLETKEGFYYHFYNLDDGKKCLYSELSDIDTSILLMNILMAGNYFKGEIEKIATEIYERVNFRYLLNENDDYFYMGVNHKGEFIAKRDNYAEQLMLYILASGAIKEEYRVDEKPYYKFNREEGFYNKHRYIYTWTGSIFTYQFSHAFIDFRNLYDKNGTNRFENSVEASFADYEYCIDNNNKYKTFNKKSWGLTACLRKSGYYGGFGAGKRGETEDTNDGTVAACGAIGSIVFTPFQSIGAIDNYYGFKEFIGEYGLYDSYNLDINWFSKNYVSIDKGISMVMIENYLNGTIWKYFSSISYIKNALKLLNICKRRK